MNTYVIRRPNAWSSAEELEQTAERSKQVAESDYPDDIRWMRSYVVQEEDGSLGTFCIYEASSREAVNEHAGKAGMPGDEIYDVVDTVIIRPDPESQPAA